MRRYLCICACALLPAQGIAHPPVPRVRQHFPSLPRYQVTKLSGAPSSANAINDAGLIVGESGDPSRATCWANGIKRDIGGPESEVATAINDAGWIVGWRHTGGTGEHAVLWRDGRTIDLGTFGGDSSYANGINRSGIVVGYAYIAHLDVTRFHAFVFDGKLRDIGTLGGDISSAAAVNDRGTVVGFSDTKQSGVWHAFAWSGGHLQDLGTLGGRKSEAEGVNDLGQIVGWAQRPNAVEDNHTMGEHAFLYDHGRMRELPYPSGLQAGPNVTISSEACGINNRGQIVGEVYGKDGLYHGALWESGHAFELNALIPPRSGWQLGPAVSINHRGQIVGYGQCDGEQCGYLLTPVGSSESEAIAVRTARPLRRPLVRKRHRSIWAIRWQRAHPKQRQAGR